MIFSKTFPYLFNKSHKGGIMKKENALGSYPFIWPKLNVKFGRFGIEPNTGLNPPFKIALNVFVSIIFFLSYILSLFISFKTLKVIIGIKPAPSDNKSNFKNVGSIPCGFNIMGTVKFIYNRKEYFYSPCFHPEILV